MEQTPAEMAKEITNKIEAIKTEVSKAVNKDDFAALEAKLNALSTSVEDAEITKNVNDLQEQINTLKEMNVEGNKERQTVKQILEANKDAIIDAFQKGRNHEFTVKATATTASVSDNTAAQRENDLSPLAVKKLSIYDLFRKIRVGRNNNGTVTYYDWDEATIARAAAMVAEGGTFPESTAAWVELSVKLKKIGDSIPVTEEFKYDTAMFADELSNFLNVNVKLVEDSQLLSGAGTGNNISGILTYAPTYTAVASSIQDASRYDLIVKVAESITKGRGNKFRPDFVLANLTEINKMRLKKDDNNNYIMPPFADRSGNIVAGIRVIEENGMADNTLVMGDSRYGKIYEDEQGYTFSTAYVDDQFIKDQETLKARKRIAFLIRESDKAGFAKVTDVDAALVTLATNPA